MPTTVANSRLSVWLGRVLWVRRIGSAVVLGLVSSGAAFAQQHACGNPFTNHYGPFDYRTAPPKAKLAVESYHYTPEVQQMLRGHTTTKLAADVAYTLNVFPNHHNALKTMADWSIKTKRNPPEGSRYTVECWFDRGLRFRPDDPMVKMIFGNYLLQIGKSVEAVKQLEEAGRLDSRNANLHYNLGLAYVKLKRFDDALRSAHIAYEGGFPLPGLRNQLKRAGVWREPQPSSREPKSGGAALSDPSDQSESAPTSAAD